MQAIKSELTRKVIEAYREKAQTFSALAKSCGCNRSQVSGIVARARLRGELPPAGPNPIPRTKPTKDRDGLIVTALLDGMTRGEVAERFGITTAVLRKVLTRARKRGHLPAAVNIPPSTQRKRVRQRKVVVPAVPLPSIPAGEGFERRRQVFQQMVESHGCKWPIGNPRAPDFQFCCAPRQEGRSYCPEHHAKAFRPLPPRRAVVTNERGRPMPWWLAV